VIPVRTAGRPVIGVLGGGQLGRMLGLAGIPLGARFVFLDPDPHAPAAEVGELVTAPYDVASLGNLAGRCDVVTWEFENVPDAAARWLADRVLVAPPPLALERTQDRLVEKTFVRSQNLPTALHARVGAAEDIPEAVGLTGLPALLKTRRLGYDGRGQTRLARVDEGPAAWDAIGRQPAILEGVVPFAHEWSVLAVRSTGGEVRTWTLTRTHHVDGILAEAVADPHLAPPELADQARRLSATLLDSLQYVGVAGIECFEVDGRLLVNEIAPRVHNSGHWTIEGAETSQFENHLRAILDLPLGSTASRGVSHMVNLIGDVPDLADVLAAEGAHLHLYAKHPRPGRKLGHITVRGDDPAAVAAAAGAVRAARRERTAVPTG
jgi:5-(carboxyamino)imidazole ribonucleotide synthase